MGQTGFRTQRNRSKSGRRADLGIYVRSSWEANFARYLNLLIERGEIESWEFEPVMFEFGVKRGSKYYTPDFRVVYPDGHHEWTEVKGYLDPVSKTKLKRFAKYFPEEILVLVDSKAYKLIQKEYANLLPEWEFPEKKV